MPRPSYRIDPLFAEFEDPEVERGFREHIRDVRVHDTRLAVALGSLFYIAFAFTDFLNVGANPDYLHILLTRLAVASLGIVVAWKARRYWRWMVNGVLPGCDAVATTPVAQHLRYEVKQCAVDLGDAALNFTVSIGTAQWFETDSVNSLLRRADQALSAAKYQGRDRVESSRNIRPAGGIAWS